MNQCEFCGEYVEDRYPLEVTDGVSRERDIAQVCWTCMQNHTVIEEQPQSLPVEMSERYSYDDPGPDPNDPNTMTEDEYRDYLTSHGG